MPGQAGMPTNSSMCLRFVLSFDLFFAVAAPLIVLVFSYRTFDFERDRFVMYSQYTPDGSFERQARMMADPSQISLFLLNFDELRMHTALDFVLRVSMNLSCCYRLKRVIEVRIRQRRKLLYNEKADVVMSIQPPTQRSVPKAMVLPFIIVCAFVLVYTNRCIESSLSACDAYPTCIAHAHRADNDGMCPCLVLIDVGVAPASYDEWTHPPNVTETVQELAASGDLKVLQLINRGLETFPDELQSCTNMQHMYVRSSEWLNALGSGQCAHKLVWTARSCTQIQEAFRRG